jgi:HAD superfamily hydrolase (TIGR01549 family)
MGIRAVLLDMDGTIWDSPVDWAEVRRRVGLGPDPYPILHHLRRLPPEQREEKERVLLAAEAEGVARGRLAPGAVELLAWLRDRDIKTALVTNNSRTSLEAVLARHPLDFDRTFSREEIPLKPDPGAFLVPLAALGVPPGEACVVGDSHLDLIAADRAGVAEVVLVSPREWMRPLFPDRGRFHEARDLWEVREILARLLGEG